MLHNVNLRSKDRNYEGAVSWDSAIICINVSKLGCPADNDLRTAAEAKWTVGTI